MTTPADHLEPPTRPGSARTVRGRLSHPASRPRPSRLGRFEVTGLLGVGGMGQVLEGYDPDLDRAVAIKLFDPGGRSSGGAFQLALEEARIAAQLEHPNIVPVYEIGEGENGEVFFVMRRVGGQSLGSVLKGLRAGDTVLRAHWSRHRLLGAFVSLCNAVAYAHRLGVVHRDIKPGNVMLGSFGEVQLLDWGVAHRVDDALGRKSDPGRGIVGTPGYISPEQVIAPDDDVDLRADVWSLGVLLYEMLTLRPAYGGRTPTRRLESVVVEDIADPRERAPEARIPEEVALICLQALAREPSDRHAGADLLAMDVERFLDGSRQRQRALEHLDEAAELWMKHAQLEAHRGVLMERERKLAASTEPWAPLSEKRLLLAVRQELTHIEPDRAALFARSVGSAERALSQDPDNRDARAFLAMAYWTRFLEAEEAGDVVRQRYLAERVAEYDDGFLTRVRVGTGALTLQTDPPGAEVVCRRVDRETLPWSLGEPTPLGVTPLHEVPLEMGSYVLTLKHPEHADTTYPVFIGRGGHWTSGVRPVGLAPARPAAEGFVYVPAGAFLLGGDPKAQDAAPREERWVDAFEISALPVTMGEYCEFINSLAASDPEAAWRRSPRQDMGVHESGGQYWERPAAGGPFVVPERDRDGDPWDENWPVMGISWHDAKAYVAWRSERDGVTWQLPTEAQWEKAARGVDGRIFPWGDELDPSLCAMRTSFPGRPQPRPVGMFDSDRSVYGVRDLAGGIRDWCRERSYLGDSARRPVRGGSWDSEAAYCRGAHRTGYIPTYVGSSFGFRLVRELEEGRSEEP